MIPLSPPSVQRTYSEFWSRDPSFVQAPTEAEDAELSSDAKAALAEHKRKIRIARETGDWSALRVAGSGEPTMFQVEPLPGNAWRWIMARVLGGEFDLYEVAALVFRVCIRDVVNGGIEDIDREDHKALGRIATVAVTNHLDAFNPSIVTEIGLALWERGTRGLLAPK